MGTKIRRENGGPRDKPNKFSQTLHHPENLSHSHIAHIYRIFNILKPHPLPPRFMGYYSNYTTKSIQRKPFECLSNVSTSKLHLTKIE